MDPATAYKIGKTAWKYRRPLALLAGVLIVLQLLLIAAIAGIFYEAWQAVYNVAFKPSMETAAMAYVAANECPFTTGSHDVNVKASTAILVAMAWESTGGGNPIPGSGALGTLGGGGLIFGSYRNPIIFLNQLGVPTGTGNYGLNTVMQGALGPYTNPNNINVNRALLLPGGETNDLLHLGGNKVPVIPEDWTTLLSTSSGEHGVGFLLITPSDWLSWTQGTAIKHVVSSPTKLDPWRPLDAFEVMACHILDIEQGAFNGVIQTVDQAITLIGNGVLQVWDWIKGVLQKIDPYWQSLASILKAGCNSAASCAGEVAALGNWGLKVYQALGAAFYSFVGLGVQLAKDFTSPSHMYTDIANFVTSGGSTALSAPAGGQGDAYYSTLMADVQGVAAGAKGNGCAPANSTYPPFFCPGYNSPFSGATPPSDCAAAASSNVAAGFYSPPQPYVCIWGQCTWYAAWVWWDYFKVANTTLRGNGGTWYDEAMAVHWKTSPAGSPIVGAAVSFNEFGVPSDNVSHPGHVGIVVSVDANGQGFWFTEGNSHPMTNYASSPPLFHQDQRHWPSGAFGGESVNGFIIGP